MPFRDTEAFLPECLDSVCAQAYPNWELIAVDDRSGDKSRELLASYASRHGGIRVFQNEGEGIIPALRTAYSHAKGPLITRMDSDDIMAPERLAHMAGELKKKGRGHLSVGLVRYFSQEGISDGYDRYQQWLNGLTRRGANFSELYKECVVPSPCWMAWREDLEACGAFRPDRYPEDYDLCFRFYEAGLSCLPCDRVLHLWRDYPERTSRNSEHYAQNYFLEIKTHYFLRLHRDTGRELFVWGAGFKGKKVARLLTAAGTPFTWVCDNPRKIGKRIYGIPLFHYSHIKQKPGSQSIITVANAAAQKEIRAFLQQDGARSLEDFFFFC